MAKRIRKPPSVSEQNDPRAVEYWRRDIEELLQLVGERTLDIGSISAGAIGTFTITVNGAKANKGQTVHLGLPSAFNTGLVPWGYVSADNTVTVVFRNPTGGAIDPPSATYTARVMP